ncbi:energy transducer TonB [Hydrogenophaga sp. D2P1]|uniref:Energy transducer TonB n=1 Tax=Hydrogenophaga aromaticivorans TaxID=2610898 RepID=A0A7Y8L092_9BURK|nr:energy transducer TonB [Hydrogenophaga aromaticivorans]NWF48839.1 energy transducer TonB [Hydrogenophaga aromaticivorans]
MDRRLFIVIAVVGFHVLGLWALQTGLLRRAVELVVPVQVMAEFIELPQPQVTPTPPPPQPQPAPVPKRVTPPVPRPAPQPVAIADPTPSPTAATGTTEPQPPAPPMLAAPPMAAEPSPPAPPKIVLPSSDAAHLNNPQPPYPKLSSRLGETGVVVLRVRVEIDGTPSQVQILESSGYDRLDQAALTTVKNLWRFVPGTKDGTPIPSWVVQQLRFEITK